MFLNWKTVANSEKYFRILKVFLLSFTFFNSLIHKGQNLQEFLKVDV